MLLGTLGLSIAATEERNQNGNEENPKTALRRFSDGSQLPIPQRCYAENADEAVNLASLPRNTRTGKLSKVENLILLKCIHRLADGVPFNLHHSMPDVIQSAQQEFWHSPASVRSRTSDVLSAFPAACSDCDAEFIPGAAFCHACGATRALVLSSGWLSRFEISNLQVMFGLSRASLIAFFFGLACAQAALLAGIFSNPQTVLDWQVVQSWRIEWLLASVAAFVAGILLKRPSSR